MNTQTFSIEPLESRMEMRRLGWHRHCGWRHLHIRFPFYIYIHRHCYVHFGPY